MYRDQRNYENLNRAKFIGAGAFDIPRILAEVPATPQSWIGFNYAKSCKDPANKAVHFFVDDYQLTACGQIPTPISICCGDSSRMHAGFQHIHRFPESRSNLEPLPQALARRVLARQRDHGYSDHLLERRKQLRVVL